VSQHPICTRPANQSYLSGFTHKNSKAMKNIFLLVVTLVILKLFFPSVGSSIVELVEKIFSLINAAIAHLPASVTGT
jgi:hypothetical protein